MAAIVQVRAQVAITPAQRLDACVDAARQLKSSAMTTPQHLALIPTVQHTPGQDILKDCCRHATPS